MRTIAAVPENASAVLYRRFSTSEGEHVLIVPHSRVFDLNADLARAWDGDPIEAARLAVMLGEQSSSEAALSSVVMPDAQSISLNVSSACNLSCGYCYADRGNFGGAQEKRMTREIALAAVDRLLAQADAAAPVTVGFLGGEPLLNRALVHDVVSHAELVARGRGLDLRFSITTNGTLISHADIDVMRRRKFAVTVSVDGDQTVHDRQRPTLRGQGSFAKLAEHLAPLLADPGHAQVAARMTVRTGQNDLARRFDAVLDLGFAEVGVSPLRASADGSQMSDGDWPDYLAELKAVSRRELERAFAGGRIRLTNLAVALKQIHSGASSPYPCGAGGGYFSVAATGKWYACHRAIGEEDFEMGDNQQFATARRQEFLIERHVHSQTDCQTCWARYLCSGSCHQEATSRTTASCDFVRAWLDFCLASYCELGSIRPDYFGAPALH